MAINIFAGARRVALLLASGIVGGTVFLVWTERPYLQQNVFVDDPNPYMPLVKREGSCSYFDGWHSAFETVQSPAGYSISVTVCARSEALAKSRTSDITARLFTADELAEMDRLGAQQVLDGRKDLVLGGIVALAAFFGITWSIGWVVRGFLGIPRGMDHRPDYDSAAGEQR